MLTVLIMEVFSLFFTKLNATQEDVNAVVDRHQPYVVIYGSMEAPRKVVLFRENVPVLEVNLVQPGDHCFVCYLLCNELRVLCSLV